MSSFVNHQFQELLYTKDPETRRRHANAIKQLSPPRGQDNNAKQAAGFDCQTEYEKWWYAQKNEIVRKLESSEEQQKQQQVQENASRGILQEDRTVPKQQQGQQSAEISPIRQQQQASSSTNANSSVSPNHTTTQNSNNRSMSQSNNNSNSRSPSRIPGTEYEPVHDHESHLYLHHHNVSNHIHEGMVRHPDNVEQRRLMEEEAKKSPSRHGANLSSYEKWWYEERDRILDYVHSHSSQPRN